ncbi:type I phosphomannose isomerase catalytic subunit [Aquimarina sp. MMG016]|uniref:type I phosphomannose isomerase catalytic subunit n=1 Tax=Aquimarina sp. MMG016 TaxID=2822690 RepID=UPI001B39D49A|nr:type I phosphomannose isomerase catalytic subunit [Aquimarina sp. MMG016]MBQ4822855.1 class I mannose-6-phosphate isomerase [Aquimarina sp. MMG016]
MSRESLYILKFAPILKEKIWGGSKLTDLLHKDSESSLVGESWEISDVDGDCSVVSIGHLQGKTLRELLLQYKEDLVGVKNFKRFGNKFPLLIKFIDAKEDLSVQLHPDDKVAKQKHNSLGKTEMWHIVQADKEANIIVGFNCDVSKDVYQKHLDEKSIKNILNYESAVEGDTFFIHPGLIHAIGAGVLLAEIQQTSDITYRIYDWDRKDQQGKYRELHQEDALEAIDFNPQDYKIQYEHKTNQVVDLVSCPHFIANVIEIDTTITVSHADLDSFVIYMCVLGQAIIESEENTVELKMGETILVPAKISEVRISSDKARLLQTYI